MNGIFIGTSGWVYKEWANDFYKGLKPAQHFAHYATQFPTVEINATFYRLPNLPMVHGWREKAPPGFIFAVKGSRYITHIKRLNNLERSVGNFSRRIEPLGEKLGPLLWQLPPNFKPDRQRLEAFLKRLPRRFSHAIAVTADFIYIRFHGLTGGPHHDYTFAEMKPWAQHIQEQARQVKMSLRISKTI